MISKRIRSYRTRKGLSQKLLAEISGISLRTVQRIEDGEIQPHGDTLQRLAEALEVTPEQIVADERRESKGYLSALNISALAFLAFPLLGVIVPFVLWITRRDEIRRVDEVGKKLLNFQITWTLAFFGGLFAYIIWYSNYIGAINDVSPSIIQQAVQPLYWLFGILYMLNLILILLNTIRAGQGRTVWYYPRVNFIQD